MRPMSIATMATAAVSVVGILLSWAGPAWTAGAAAGPGTRAGINDGVAGSRDGKRSHVSAAARAQAASLLRSDLGRRLSATGRNALELISAASPSPPRLTGGHEQASRDGLAFGSVRVNDPSLDAFANLDITTQSETAVAAYTSGRSSTVLVSYNDSGEYLTTGCFMGYSRSTNGGRSFTDMGIVPPGATEINLGDPALVADRQGHFYSSSIVFDFALPDPLPYRVAIQKSMDGGVTWGSPVYAPPFAPLSFTDKDFMAVDNSERATSGNVYVTWTNFDESGGGALPIVLSRSTDGGASFSTPIQISQPGTFNQGSEPAVGPDGTVYVAWNEDSGTGPYGAQRIMVAKSTDGGLSFDTPVFVAPAVPIGFASGSLAGNIRGNSFPRIDVNPANEQVYIVFSSNPPGPDPADVLFTRSVDGGATWSTPVRVNDDTGLADQWFPDLAVNQDGKIRVFWYDRRGHGDRPGDVLLDVFGATSVDGGISFGTNRRVRRSNPWQDEGMLPAVGFDPLVASTYMGDYNDIKVDMTPDGPGRGFFSAWGDCSRIVTTEGGSRPDQDVVFARQSASVSRSNDALSTGLDEEGGDPPTAAAPHAPATPVASALPSSLAASVSPNPSGREVILRYSLPAADWVRLTIYDLAGREVARPVDASKPAGAYEARWDVRASSAAPQIYLYRLEALGRTLTGRFAVR